MIETPEYFFFDLVERLLSPCRPAPPRKKRRRPPKRPRKTARATPAIAAAPAPSRLTLIAEAAAKRKASS